MATDEPKTKQPSRWRKSLSVTGSIFGGLVIGLILWLPNSSKTLWDWLELLIIPAALAGAAFGLNRSERRNEIKIASERAENERRIATDRLHEQALQAYLDRMTELLLEKGLRESQPDAEVRSVARARTLTALRGLDGDREGSLARFLLESGLITKIEPASAVVISLEGADLSGANLHGANLCGAILFNAYLNDADLSFANLNRAKLSFADLSSAKLSFADLSHAALIMADLHGAYLHRAILRGANLDAANLGGAYLHEAELSDADLKRANLSGADLSGAIVTAEQLAQVKSLQGATMPDGTEYD